MNKIILTVIVLLGLFSPLVHSSANCDRDPVSLGVSFYDPLGEQITVLERVR